MIAKDFRYYIGLKYPNFTLLAIYIECGFKSSSSFYSIVKEEYGVTPKVLTNQISS
ncbi:MAG: AraC family transcriptional regulator [Pleomorphochaeta sp.]